MEDTLKPIEWRVLREIIAARGDRRLATLVPLPRLLNHLTRANQSDSHLRAVGCPEPQVEWAGLSQTSLLVCEITGTAKLKDGRGQLRYCEFNGHAQPPEPPFRSFETTPLQSQGIRLIPPLELRRLDLVLEPN